MIATDEPRYDTLDDEMAGKKKGKKAPAGAKVGMTPAQYKAHRKEQIRLAVAAKREKARAEKKCIVCMDLPAREGSVVCEECNERNKEAVYAARESAGD